MSNQKKSYEKQELKNQDIKKYNEEVIKKHNDLNSRKLKIYFTATLFFGLSLITISSTSVFIIFVLVGTVCFFMFFQILFSFKPDKKYNRNDFCPDCGSVVHRKIKDSKYINTTTKRKDGHDDLRFNKTGYTHNTYHYICTMHKSNGNSNTKCTWSNIDNPRPANHSWNLSFPDRLKGIELREKAYKRVLEKNNLNDINP